MPADPSRFIPCLAFPAGLQGLTSQLLADVNDIILKVGLRYSRTRRMFRLQEVPEVIVFLNEDDETSPVLHLASAEPTPNPVLHFVIEMTMGTRVLWDIRLDVESMSRAVAITDEKLLQAGLRNPRTGIRREAPTSQNPSVQYQVNETFRNRGFLLTINPEDLPPGYIVRMFDHPEELVVLETEGDEDGDVMLCRRADLPFIRRQNALLAEVATMFGQPHGKTPDEPIRLAVCAEVERRLALEFGKDPNNPVIELPEA